jgi:hypothetical protein
LRTETGRQETRTLINNDAEIKLIDFKRV